MCDCNIYCIWQWLISAAKLSQGIEICTLSNLSSGSHAYTHPHMLFFFILWQTGYIHVLIMLVHIYGMGYLLLVLHDRGLNICLLPDTAVQGDTESAAMYMSAIWTITQSQPTIKWIYRLLLASWPFKFTPMFSDRLRQWRFVSGWPSAPWPGVGGQAIPWDNHQWLPMAPCSQGDPITGSTPTGPTLTHCVSVQADPQAGTSLSLPVSI